MWKEISLVNPASKDPEITVCADSFKQLRDSINEMSAVRGEAPLTKNELPEVTQDCSYYAYASHAVNEIEKCYRMGKACKDGMVMWC
jgi:hypothetical protein